MQNYHGSSRGWLYPTPIERPLTVLERETLVRFESPSGPVFVPCGSHELAQKADKLRLAGWALVYTLTSHSHWLEAIRDTVTVVCSTRDHLPEACADLIGECEV